MLCASEAFPMPVEVPLGEVQCEALPDTVAVDVEQPLSRSRRRTSRRYPFF